MPGINVNVEVVKDVKTNISQYIKNLEEVDLAALDRIMQQLDMAWKSQYTEEYISCIMKTRRKLANLIYDLKELERMLGNTAMSVENAEERLRKILTLGQGD